MLSRRKLIVTALQSALALSGAHYLTACSEQDAAPVKLNGASRKIPRTPLVDYALGMQAISYVGAVCLQKIGFGEDTPDLQLQAQLAEQLENQIATLESGAGIPQKLDSLIRDDFAGNRLFEIEGWQLSETECRLAALAASMGGFREPVTPAPLGPKQGEIVDVVAWGPQSTPVGEKFNEQLDGHCGLWFKAEGAPFSAMVVFAGRNQGTNIYPDSFTSGVHGLFMEEIINTPGEYSIELYDKTNQIIQPIGTFRVTGNKMSAGNEQAQDVSQCYVEAWGPTQSDSGRHFNLQPGGYSAFWVKTNCAVDGSILIMAGVELETTVQKNLLTAKVPNGHELAPGKYPLEIRVGNSERRLKTGELEVR